MQQQSENNQHYNDEIDLADLVRSLWDGKWLVIGVTFVTVMLALVYLLLVPKTYTGSLEIKPLPSVQADVYTELSATELVAVDEQVLLSLLIEDLKSYDGIGYFIKENGYIEQQENETDHQFDSRARITASSFTFSSASGKYSVPHWVINISTQSPDLATLVVADSLVRSIQNVNEQVGKSFLLGRDEHSRKQRVYIENLELEKQRAVFQYDAGIRARLAVLGEQAQIARSLNIGIGTPFVVASIHKESSLYLRGYLALEKEMEIIASREAPELFIPEFAAIEVSKLELLQDRTVARADELFNNTPIGTDQFTAAVYDLASVEYKSKTKKSLILALSIVLGGMLGIFVLLIRNALTKRD